MHTNDLFGFILQIWVLSNPIPTFYIENKDWQFFDEDAFFTFITKVKKLSHSWKQEILSSGHVINTNNTRQKDSSIGRTKPISFNFSKIE